MKRDLTEKLGTVDVAAYLGWSRWRARRWMRASPAVWLEGREYKTRLANVLEAFPWAMRGASERLARLTYAGDVERLRTRLATLERTVGAQAADIKRLRASLRKLSNARNARTRRTSNL